MEKNKHNSHFKQALFEMFGIGKPKERLFVSAEEIDDPVTDWAKDTQKKEEALLTAEEMYSTAEE